MSKISIFIDESGTLGLKEKEPYFIITAIILAENQKNPLKNMVKKLKKSFSVNELHATEMSFYQKEIFFNFLERREYSYQYFVAQKNKIDPTLFSNKSVCFNYFIYLFLKNILENTTITEIHIVIDMRNIKVTSVKNLEEYLQLKLIERRDYNKKIFVNYGDSKQHNLLQAVDILSNAIYAKYNYSKKHFFSRIKGKLLLAEHFPQYRFRHIDKKKL
ncbi:MAG TPA: DUF3800 domain-containing protein [Candidatus Paceibacterota bacterium]|nr:DUF3800 domain-containing protein [Candidatus Paceibacterota bacterium]